MEFIVNMVYHMAIISTCFFSEIHSCVTGKQPHLHFQRHVGTKPVPGECVNSHVLLGTFGPELSGMLTITAWPTRHPMPAISGLQQSHSQHLSQGEKPLRHGYTCLKLQGNVKLSSTQCLKHHGLQI